MSGRGGFEMTISKVAFWLMIFTLGTFVVMITVWLGGSQEYITNNIVECNDNDGDVIEGLICHEKVTCSTNLIFLNVKICEEVLK